MYFLSWVIYVVVELFLKIATQDILACVYTKSNLRFSEDSST